MPDLIDGSAGAYASNALILCSQSMDFASEFFRRRFARSGNRLVRATLGQPRFAGGMIRLASRLPIVMASLASHDWGRAIVFLMLAAADIASALSQPAMAHSSTHDRLEDGISQLQVIRDHLVAEPGNGAEPVLAKSTTEDQDRATA